MDYLFILIYIVIILAVIEINVIIFTLTGLERHISRFQVISMLTGTGFTTGESELIISHPVRRKLGAFLILFGAFSLAVIISAISNILAKNFLTKEIAYGAGVLIFISLILRIPALQKILSKKLQEEMVKKYNLEDLPVSDVFLTGEDDLFVEIPLHHDSTYIGKTLRDSIKKYAFEDINVIFIKRGEDVVIRKEKLDTELVEGDQLIIYGDKNTLKQAFGNEIEAKEEKIVTAENVKAGHI